MEAKSERPRRRPRLTVDAPDFVVANVKKTADRYFRGSLSDAAISAFALLSWYSRQRMTRRRVISVPWDHLPQVFEEPLIPELEDAMNTKWTWLVEREHQWIRQLWIKGRNITAGSLARTMDIEGWSAEKAALEFDLEADAVIEAVQWASQNAALIEAEEAENRIAAQQTSERAAESVPLP